MCRGSKVPRSPSLTRARALMCPSLPAVDDDDPADPDDLNTEVLRIVNLRTCRAKPGWQNI
eukprot:11783530-Alexandrium_andersonii.AAC.1